MLRRLFAFVVALVVAAAPVALEACQAICASSVAHSAAPHSAISHASHDGGRSCHAHAVNGLQVSHAPQRCDHGADDQSPALNVVEQRSSIAAALAVLPVSGISIDEWVPTLTFWLTLSLQRAVPTTVRPAIPLRI
jgi:hypothetical protein